MKLQTPPSGEEAVRYLALIGQGAVVTRHVELLNWLQGDLQQCLPHDILLAGWGDFQEGAIQHDILSPLPGVRSYAPGTDTLPFLLAKLHDCWVAAHRQPCRLNFGEFGYLLGSSNLPGSICSVLHGMRSVLIHGLRDARSRQECLYVLLSSHDIPEEPAMRSITWLMPHIDAALRQLALLPQQSQPPSQLPPSVAARGAQEEVCGLSERETQIMAWVAMGKTNSEIGAILNISGFTVKNHMQRIFQKLNVFNRVQAVSKVTRVGLDG